MSDTYPKRQELLADDGLRMQRLAEEVRGRLHEMALIVRRTLDLRADAPMAARFVPHKRLVAEAEDAGAGDWMEIDEVDGFEVCWGVIDGHAFAESPCGAGG